MTTEILKDGSVMVSDIIDGQREKKRYFSYSVAESVIKFAEEFHNFKVHGTYTVSNSIGYLVELSDCGTGARALYPGDKPELTEWSEIVSTDDPEDPENFISVFDANGYEIELSNVMRIQF